MADAGIVVNMYLTDLFDIVKIRTTPADILTRLTANLQDVFDFANSKKKEEKEKHKFNVSWATLKPALKDTDYIVHYIPVDFWSLARFMLDGKKHQLDFATEWGLTSMRPSEKPTLVCSEVYVKTLQAEPLADLAFHEMMHGKLAQGDGMHVQGGLGSAVLGAGIALNDANRAALAGAITTPRRMWPDAWDLASGAATLKKGGDDLWNL